MDIPVETYSPTLDLDQSLTVLPVSPQNPHKPHALRVKWIEKSDHTETFRKQWEKLQNESLYQNATMECSYLTPALTHLADESVRLLVVEKCTGSETELVGLIPFETKKLYGLPLRGIEIWKHDHSFDTTPLLHSQFAVQAWEAVCKFLANEKTALLSLDTVSAEPAFESVLQVVQKKLGLQRFQRDAFQRAALFPGQSAEVYMKQHCSKNARKNKRRMDRKLAELGDVEYKLSDKNSDWEYLANEFVRLEESGWKGREGTSLRSNPQTEAFYRDLVRQSAAAGKARFVTLSIDGVPIAMLSDIRAGRSGQTVYCYKSAFDESYHKFSPGKLCELENIEFLHNDNTIEIADSCTSPENEIHNNIWGQKLAFQKVVFSLQSGLANSLVKCLPVTQQVVKRLKRLTGKQ